MADRSDHGNGFLVSRVSRSAEAHDRLTRIADHMVKSLREMGPEVRDVRVVLMLSNDVVGGMVIDGYDDEPAAMTDALGHMEAWARTRGLAMRFTLPGETPDGR